MKRGGLNGSPFYFQHSPHCCFIVGECYGSDMDDKKGQHKKIKRRTCYVQVDGLDISATEVIEVDFTPQQKEKTERPD